MKFGITMFPTHYAIHPVRLGALVEEMGFDSVWLPEHSHIPTSRVSQYPQGGDLPMEFAHMCDPFECLAAIAGATSRVLLGTSTLVIPDHDPILLAKRVSTLDLVSNGRVLLGVGAGWNMEEIANHGVAPENQFRYFRECMEAVIAIWTNDEAEYHGKLIDFDPIWQWPKPVQAPHPPIYVGGKGPKLAQRVFGFGTAWLASGRSTSDELLPVRIKELEQYAVEHGREMVPVSMTEATPTREAIDDYITAGLERCIFRVPIADEATVTAKLEEYVKLIEPYTA